MEKIKNLITALTELGANENQVIGVSEKTQHQIRRSIEKEMEGAQVFYGGKNNDTPHKILSVTTHGFTIHFKVDE